MANVLKYMGFMALFFIGVTQTPLTHAQVIQTPAKQAYIVDLSSNTVLFEKNADQPMFPSSMTKIMTVYVVLEKIKQGSLRLQDTFLVSEKAWKTQGSKMFVGYGTSVSVQDLLNGVITVSGNDACVVLAEGIAGSEKDFGTMITEKAKTLGAVSTHFVNSSGMPDPNHVTTAKDLALISYALIRDFPDEYNRFSQNEMTYNGIRQTNRNPLLGRFPGADGIKTGHTDLAGYGLVGSAIQGKRRLLLVVNGYESAKQRLEDTHRLMNWGFREFETFVIGSGKIHDIDVWLGDAHTVGIYLKEPLAVTIARENMKNLRAEIHYTGPVPAPITKDQAIATCVVFDGTKVLVEKPLYAMENVGEMNVFYRLPQALKYIFNGKN